MICVPHTKSLARVAEYGRPVTARTGPIPVTLAALLAITGIVWILQGIGYLPGSFMSGDPTWAYVGAALLVVAAALAIVAYRSRAASR